MLHVGAVLGENCSVPRVLHISAVECENEEVPTSSKQRECALRNNVSAHLATVRSLGPVGWVGWRVGVGGRGGKARGPGGGENSANMP